MREVDRVGVIREVLGRRLGQGEASERLGICVRQVKRLVRRYREEGARGLRSRRGGRRASNGIAPELRREIVGVVRERYEDFAPTLAWEKLTEVHGYGVSVETLRKWMVAEGLWRSSFGLTPVRACVHARRPLPPSLDVKSREGSLAGCVKTPSERGNGPRNRHSRESGNPGGVEWGNGAWGPLQDPWIPAFAGMTDWLSCPEVRVLTQPARDSERASRPLSRPRPLPSSARKRPFEDPV